MKKFLLMCFSFGFAISLSAQDRVVTGKLTAKEDGSSLPGVNVVLKGTTTGTVSDAEGNYKLTVPASGGTLVFSFIGLETQEVEIGDRNVVDLQLGTDIKQLSEVVVTAQGIQQEKRALGYAITTVSGTAVENRPEQDIGRLLDGKITGVNVTSSTGVAGSATNIIIRGYNTVTGTKQPLFIVDGVPFNSDTNTPGGQSDAFNGSSATSSRFMDLDQNNIENIQVLKGLSAAVLYGANGRNGVIIVTTKNGRAAKGQRFEVNVNQSVFVSKIASLPDYQPAYGDGFQQNYGPFFSNWGPAYTQLDSIPNPYGNFSDASLQAQFPQYVGTNIKYQPFTHSVKNFFNTGLASTTSVNLNGSKDNVSYNFSVSSSKENGFVPNNTLGKTNIGTGVNADLTKKLNMTVSMNYAQTDMATPPISAGNGSGIAGGGLSIFSDVLYTPVNVDLMGLPFEAPVDHRSVYYRSGNDIQNPRWTAKYTKQTDAVRRFYGNVALNFKITSELKATYRAGLDTYNETQEYDVNKGGPQNINGFYRSQNIQNTIVNNDFILTYAHQFNQDFRLTATGGVQSRYDYRNSFGMYSSNQVIFGQMNHNNFLSHSNNDGLTGANLNYMTQLRQEGVYATATVDYKDYLYLNLQGRNDWYSSLEKANNSIFYPSASLSFVPTTAFGIESETLNSLKVRASYGSSANFPPPYQTRNYINANSRPYLDKSGNPLTTHSVSDLLGNPNLKPELLSEIEFGVEATLLKRRLDVEASYYTRQTTKAIMNAPIDPSTGNTSTYLNLGKLTTDGVEITLHGVPIIAGDFKWDLSLNFTHYNSIVNSLGVGLSQVQLAGYSGGASNWAIQGMPFSEIQGTYAQRDANGNLVVGADGNYISSHDIKPLGNPNPDYTSYLTSGFSFKGITLSARLDYRKGGKIYSTTAGTELARGITQDTNFNREATFILPGVKEDGTKNDIQLTSSDTFFNNYGFGPNEFQVYDGTTIRLGQVSLGYSLPKAMISKTPFKAINITFNGQNLWYNAVNFPKHSHFDTNQLSTGVGNALGLDFLTGPSARKYGFTLGLKF